MWFHKHKSPNHAVATTDNNWCSVQCVEIALWLIAIMGEVLISAVTTISFRNICLWYLFGNPTLCYDRVCPEKNWTKLRVVVVGSRHNSICAVVLVNLKLMSTFIYDCYHNPMCCIVCFHFEYLICMLYFKAFSI